MKKQILLFLLLLVGVIDSKAAVLFESFPTTVSTENQIWSSTVGYSFTVGLNNLQVFRIWDFDNSKSQTIDQVGIWDSSQNLLTSVSFSNSVHGVYLGGSYMAAPLTLFAGQQYTLAACAGVTQSPARWTDNYTTDPSTKPVGQDVTFDWGVRNNSQYTFSYPSEKMIATGTFTGTTFKGLNLEYNLIPEPSTYALFGIGAIGLLIVMRRKKAA